MSQYNPSRNDKIFISNESIAEVEFIAEEQAQEYKLNQTIENLNKLLDNPFIQKQILEGIKLFMEAQKELDERRKIKFNDWVERITI